jgi:hypothetical protein
MELTYELCKSRGRIGDRPRFARQENLINVVWPQFCALIMDVPGTPKKKCVPFSLSTYHLGSLELSFPSGKRGLSPIVPKL